MKQTVFCALQGLLLVISSVFILMCYNKKISWVTDNKHIFIAFVVLGIILCIIGIMLRVVGPYKYTNSSQWISIFMFIDVVLGIIAIVDIYLGFSQKQFLYVKDYLTASNVLAAVILLKIVCSLVKGLLNK